MVNLIELLSQTTVLERICDYSTLKGIDNLRRACNWERINYPIRVRVKDSGPITLPWVNSMIIEMSQFLFAKGLKETVLLYGRGKYYIGMSHRNPIYIPIPFSDCQEAIRILKTTGKQIDSTKQLLFQAIHFGNFPMVQFLIDEGEDIQAKEFGKITTLSKAANMGFIEIVEFLLTRGNQQNFDQDQLDDALCNAVSHGSHEIVQLLLKFGANPNGYDMYGRHSLWVAMYWLKIETPQLLIEKGADLNVQNKYGRTALMHAITGSNFHSVKLLVEAGANIHLQDRSRKNACFLTVEIGRADMLEYLLPFQPNVNIITQNRFTSLLMAVQRKNLKAVQLLVKAGADRNYRNKKKKNALDISIEKNYEEIRNFLEELG